MFLINQFDLRFVNHHRFRFLSLGQLILALKKSTNLIKLATLDLINDSGLRHEDILVSVKSPRLNWLLNIAWSLIFWNTPLNLVFHLWAKNRNFLIIRLVNITFEFSLGHLELWRLRALIVIKGAQRISFRCRLVANHI